MAEIILYLPFGKPDIKFSFSEKQFDELDLMFSRMELEEGTQKFEDYYGRQPQNKASDDAFRREPGLLQRRTK